MSVFVRSLRSGAVWLALGVAVTGCNFVLGINEPEEIDSPPVRYYPWDGASFDETDGSDLTDGANVSADGPPVDTPGAVDARPETGSTCSNVPLPDGGVCGTGCTSLCPLGRVCLKDGDCVSGRCFGARCTLAACTNGMRDGQETDIDCGGLCAACGTGRACRISGDCASRSCTNGLCLAPPVDASVDGRFVNDASAVPDGPLPADANVTSDASGSIESSASADSNVVDAGAPADSNFADGIGSMDSDVVTAAREVGISCEAGCAPCACPDGP